MKFIAEEKVWTLVNFHSTREWACHMSDWAFLKHSNEALLATLVLCLPTSQCSV